VNVRIEIVSCTEPEIRRHGFESDKETFFVIPFSLIVLVFLSLFSIIYFVFSFVLFDIFSAFFIASKFISNFQCKKYNMNLKLPPS